MPLTVPPLRERREDIPVLMRHFIRQQGDGAAIHVERDVDEMLLNHDWPGNVRELKNTIERMMLLRDTDTLRAADVPPAVCGRAGSVSAQALPFELPDDGLDLNALEKALIVAVLEKVGGNQSAAARYLSIPRHVLLYRLEKFGIK